MSVAVPSAEKVDLSSESMQVICDPDNSRLQSLEEKIRDFYAGLDVQDGQSIGYETALEFYEKLDEDEKRYMRMVSFGTDKEGTIESSDELFAGPEDFEERLRQVEWETDFSPMATTPVCATTAVRATIAFTC